MYFELKENKPHGTKDDPFSTYHIKNGGRSFQIPVHWHDELEIIYVKSGFLTVKGCIFSEPAKLLNFLTTDGSKDTGF